MSDKQVEYEWYVQTPAGWAGPYSNEIDARDAARPFGYPVKRVRKGGDA
jgi:hypothetical protein